MFPNVFTLPHGGRHGSLPQSGIEYILTERNYRPAEKITLKKLRHLLHHPTSRRRSRVVVAAEVGESTGTNLHTIVIRRVQINPPSCVFSFPDLSPGKVS